MNEEQLKALIETYRPMLAKESSFERGLLMLVKDVERESRHRAVRLAQNLVTQLSDVQA